MSTDFSRTLSLLRQEKGLSQRKAAAALGISQALLSHYENGIREPGLGFVVKACDFYRVSADYLLGRTLSRDGAIIGADDLYDSTAEKGSLKGSILATLQKKLVVNTQTSSSIYWARPVPGAPSPPPGTISAAPCTSCYGSSIAAPAPARTSSPWAVPLLTPAWWMPT